MFEKRRKGQDSCRGSGVREEGADLPTQKKSGAKRWDARQEKAGEKKGG